MMVYENTKALATKEKAVVLDTVLAISVTVSGTGAGITLNSVSISVLPMTGAPSSSVPFPIYSCRVSVLQPNSAPASCGKFELIPLRLVI